MAAGVLLALHRLAVPMIIRIPIIGVAVMMVLGMDLVNQPKTFQMHVGRCRQPKGYQQQRH